MTTTTHALTREKFLHVSFLYVCSPQFPQQWVGHMVLTMRTKVGTLLLSWEALVPHTTHYSPAHTLLTGHHFGLLSSFSKHAEGKHGPVQQNSFAKKGGRAKAKQWRASQKRGEKAGKTVAVRKQPLVIWSSAWAEESWMHQCHSRHFCLLIEGASIVVITHQIRIEDEEG